MNVCSPSASPGPPSPAPYDCGLVQLLLSPPSRLHWNRRGGSAGPSSAPLNSNVASVLFVSRSGPAPIDATGATVSTVHSYDAESPRLPAPSVARTTNVCAPSDSGASPGPDPYACRLAHATHPPASSFHP